MTEADLHNGAEHRFTALFAAINFSKKKNERWVAVFRQCNAIALTSLSAHLSTTADGVCNETQTDSLSKLINTD